MTTDGEWYGWALILQEINALHQKSVWPHKIRFLCTNTVEVCEFLDASVYKHMHVVTAHECKTLKTKLISHVRKFTIFTM